MAAINSRSIFGFLLREAGYVEEQVAQITQVGAQVAAFVPTLPPVNPGSVFADILKLIGVAESELPKIQAVGAEARVVADIVSQVQGAQAELAAGQEVTANLSLYGHKYALALKPV